jgi:hypothetical protein
MLLPEIPTIKNQCSGKQLSNANLIESHSFRLAEVPMIVMSLQPLKKQRTLETIGGQARAQVSSVVLLPLAVPPTSHQVDLP